MKTEAPLSLKHALQLGKNQLPKDQEAEAEHLLAWVLSVSRAYLYTHPERGLSSSELTRYNSAICSRKAGTPVAYIQGLKEFWSLPLQVTPDTLIPRADTEFLVERVLSMTNTHKPLKLLDLGTGSGAIALALASENPHWIITACDKNPKTLAVAITNGEKLKLNNITWVESDWFSALDKAFFDVIVSNPPYIAENDSHLEDLRFEPQDALIAGIDGLDALRYIIQSSRTHLNAQGWLFLEHGFDQGEAVLKLLSQSGYINARCYQDLQGLDRVCVANAPSKP